eukprot:5314866-Pyramimonas_sp.AAC.1
MQSTLRTIWQPGCGVRRLYNCASSASAVAAIATTLVSLSTHRRPRGVEWLQIAKALPADQFVAKCVPTIVKLFGSQDRAVRVQLLTNLEMFAEHISADLMDEK